LASSNSSFIKLKVEHSAKTILESQQLIKKLYHVVKGCPVCLDKLLKEEKMAGVNQTPAQQTDDDTTPGFQAKSDIFNDIIKKRQ
jgi:hypothetical protein